MAFLRRSKSFENISELNAQPSAPVYRDPRRDLLGDDQSLMDRSTMTETYEPAQSNDYQETAPPIPARSYDRFAKEKPHRIAALIEPYKGLFDKRTANEWFKEYDRMAFANNWDPPYKARQVYFWLSNEPQRECATIIDKNPDITYDALRLQLEKCFPDDVSALSHFDNLQDRKLKKSEPVLVYFCDKMVLINKYNNAMPFELVRDWILSGLTADFRLDLSRVIGADTSKLDSLEKLRTALKETEKWRTQTRLLRPEKGVEIDDKPSNYPKDAPLDGFNNNKRVNFRKITKFNGFRNQNVDFRRNGNPNNFNRFSSSDRNGDRNSNNDRWNDQRNWRSNERNTSSERNRKWTETRQQPTSNIKDVRSVAIEGNDPRKNKKMDTRISNSNPPLNMTSQTPNRIERPKYSRGPNGEPICWDCSQIGHTRWSCPKRRQTKPKAQEN